MDPITARDMSRTVAHMFNVMDACRHLPNYRLEGRLAPFFELFLHDVLSERLGVELHPVVIPEFPLRKGTLYDNDSNQSYNVDYVAFSMDRDRKTKTAFLVELKTDMSSIGGGQEKYLHDAVNLKEGFEGLVRGIIEICKATDYCSKYAYLLHRLASLELVSNCKPEKLYQAARSRADWHSLLYSEPVCTNIDGIPQFTRVVYIQPRECKRNSGFKYIYFEHVADIVQQYGDLGCIFANFLRQWTEDPGRQVPRTAAEQL